MLSGYYCLRIIVATIAACNTAEEELTFLRTMTATLRGTAPFGWSVWSRSALKAVVGLSVLYREDKHGFCQYEFDGPLAMAYAELLLHAEHVPDLNYLATFGFDAAHVGQVFDEMLKSHETDNAIWLYNTVLVLAQNRLKRGGNVDSKTTDRNALNEILQELTHKLVSAMNVGQMLNIIALHRELFEVTQE